MSKPIIVATTTRKNNDNKHYREHEEWMKGKKLGRRKQFWVWDNEPFEGHWEEVAREAA